MKEEIYKARLKALRKEVLNYKKTFQEMEEFYERLKLKEWELDKRIEKINDKIINWDRTVGQFFRSRDHLEAQDD